MKTSSLHEFWSAPDNTRLTSKQYSFRLPVHVAAKLAALCDIYPQKTRTQIVADLLTTALEELEKNLPVARGEIVEDECDGEISEVLDQDTGEKLCFVGGARGRYRHLANSHYEALEKELGNDTPAILFGSLCFPESHFGQK